VVGSGRRLTVVGVGRRVSRVACRVTKCACSRFAQPLDDFLAREEIEFSRIPSNVGKPPFDQKEDIAGLGIEPVCCAISSSSAPFSVSSKIWVRSACLPSWSPELIFTVGIGSDLNRNKIQNGSLCIALKPARQAPVRSVNGGHPMIRRIALVFSCNRG